MKIALIQCPVWGTYDPPLALAQLTGCLKEAKQEVFIFDLNIKLYINRTENYKDMWAWEQCLFWYKDDIVDKFFHDNKEFIKKIVNEILNTGSHIIGFSVNAASRIASLSVARMLKEISKDITIVFGGPLFFEKKYIELILEDGAVDIVIPGEGEITLIELCKFIEEGRDIANCAGISYKRGGRVICSKPSEPVANLDTLPFMDFSELPLVNYDDSRHFVFMASRGCIQRCVFCSSRAFWPGYRAMSGKRIFEEIKFHKLKEGQNNPNLGHVDFIDLMFNGNIKYLVEFCDLMIKARLDLKWSANMIIRPEMTSDVINKMGASGCEHIIFGIESGSQRVLGLMKKRYRIEDAGRMIRQMHAAGIMVTGNFMFGFPGETKEDFELTLDFIKRNAKFLDRAYPSRTYCALEEFSYLAGHLEEFGIKPNPVNHLFWESVDGTNTFPERLRRCREFAQLTSSLDIEVGCGVQTSVELDEFFSLYLYYEYEKDFSKALEYLLKYFELERLNEHVKNKLQFFLQKVNENDPLFVFEKEALYKLKEAVSIIEHTQKAKTEEAVNTHSSTETVFSLLSKKENSELNDKEFETQKFILESTPKRFSFEVNGPCNSNCVFCGKPSNYDLFNLKAYRTRFENKLFPYLSKAEEIVLSGNGEFLLLLDAEEILGYFDKRFPFIKKILYTNGTALSPAVCDRVVNSTAQYIINVSLHASNPELHAALTQTENFNVILEKLKYLLKVRKTITRPAVQLIFVATNLNIDDLPAFVKLAADLGVDRVSCYYAYIYTPVQKYLSCFFKQSFANRILGEVREVARRLDVKIDLPPRFGEKEHTDSCVCRDAWSQVNFNCRGGILSCGRISSLIESLETKDFLTAWNSQNFQDLRRSLLSSMNHSCFNRCMYANPASVNNIDAHIVQSII